ncbi:MAG TPA: PilZ domain-containing protein [Thermoanaerobaculia bacterium]
MHEERRSFQRLNLTSAIDGWFGDLQVRLIDISSSGALLAISEGLPDHGSGLLRFHWRGANVEIPGELVRFEDRHVGVHFLEEDEILRRLIAESARELLEAQEANLLGDRALNVIGDETLTAASAAVRTDGYLTLRWSGTEWKKRRSLLPDQPPDGFTVSASEPEESIEMLCRTYASGDAQAQHLTRVLAELSVAGKK